MVVRKPEWKNLFIQVFCIQMVTVDCKFFSTPTSTSEERCRPPLTDLQIRDVTTGKATCDVTEYLQNLVPSLSSSSTKSSNSKKNSEEEVESFVKKLKIEVLWESE